MTHGTLRAVSFRLAVLGGAALLAACAAQGPVGGDPAPEEASQARIDPHPEEFEQPSDPAPEIPDLSAADLMGLDTRGVADVLGEPAQRRREASAEVWQYRTADCVVDVVLYGAETAKRVDYVEARDRAAQPADTADCLKDILRQNSSEPVLSS